MKRADPMRTRLKPRRRGRIGVSWWKLHRSRGLRCTKMGNPAKPGGQHALTAENMMLEAGYARRPAEKQIRDARINLEALRKRMRAHTGHEHRDISNKHKQPEHADWDHPATLVHTQCDFVYLDASRRASQQSAQAKDRGKGARRPESQTSKQS